MLLLSSADFFLKKITFSNNSFRNTITVSKSLDPDQDQLIWVQTVSKGNQKMIKVSSFKERVKR